MGLNWPFVSWKTVWTRSSGLIFSIAGGAGEGRVCGLARRACASTLVPLWCPRKTAARRPFLSCTSVTLRVLPCTAVRRLPIAQRVVWARPFETWLLLRYERYQSSFSWLVCTLGTSHGCPRCFQHPVCCCHVWQRKYLNVWRVLARAVNHGISVCVIRLLSVRSLLNACGCQC